MNFFAASPRASLASWTRVAVHCSLRVSGGADDVTVARRRVRSPALTLPIGSGGTVTEGGGPVASSDSGAATTAAVTVTDTLRPPFLTVISNS